MKLEILEFINYHENWFDILSKPPYSLIIKPSGQYILIKYNQLESDFSEIMVREARGLIIKSTYNDKYTLVCMPFKKFFAYGDPNAQEDIKALYNYKEWLIQEKIDGSLIKLFYDNNEWHVSTSGNANAGDAPMAGAFSPTTFKDKFLSIASDLIDFDKLDKDYTYLFEMIGKENKVIVAYEDDLYYLSKINNKTLEEVMYFHDDCFGVEKCKRPKCVIGNIIDGNPQKSMDLIVEQANKLKDNDTHFEGYVVSSIDTRYKIKIKSNYYLDMFYIKGDGIFTPRKILKLILEERDDDVVSKFPEYATDFNTVRDALALWINKIKADMGELDNMSFEDKKSFANWAKNTTYPPIIFNAYEKEIEDGWFKDQIDRISIKNLLSHIGIKEEE